VTYRDTGTGGVLESMILPALERGGYSVQTQVVVGLRIGGRKHRVDALATTPGRTVLVSLKWQQVGGTAEQKVPFEVICLADVMRTRSTEFDAAYLVLGGEGWTLRESADRVEILTLEGFIARANQGRL
jgi:hypothetical protein